MAQLKYLVIHCSDTVPERWVDKTTLRVWHMAPEDVPGGVKYLGKLFPDRSSLPPDKINGHYVSVLVGRGWDRLGYSDLIHRDGRIENITPYDGNNIVESHEMTWGASGINNVSRHVCLVGGKLPNHQGGRREFLSIFTEAQARSLIGYCRQFLKNYPSCKIIGHYYVSAYKACPNFNVSQFLETGGIERGFVGLFE